MRRTLGFFGALALGASLTVGGSASAAGTGTIYVPESFVPALSDTRVKGHYEVQNTGLHIYTEGSTRDDKVAEYVATSTPLSAVGQPSLDYTNAGGGVPGFQLVVDFDGNGTNDGILVGETVYGDNWWLNNAAQDFVKEGAPHEGGGSGSDWYGTLAEWQVAFPTAVVQAFGFSLGSGVKGDGVINAINFADTRYTFAIHTILDGREACKKDGWETSTSPVFTNQGDCVSYFARN